MEVSLPSPSIPQDFFNDPMLLGQQLENFHEGHYTRRLNDYINSELQRLRIKIFVDPILLPIREELCVRIQTAGFVRNTLEQLAILHFDRKDYCKKLEDLNKLVGTVNTKFEEFVNCLENSRSTSRPVKRVDLSKEMEELHGQYKKTDGQVRKLRNDLIFRALRKYEDIRKRLLKRNNNIASADGVLRMYILEFNTIPVSLTINQIVSTETKMNDLRFEFRPVLKRFYEDLRAEKAEAENVIPRELLYGSLFILSEAIIWKILFRKPILK